MMLDIFYVLKWWLYLFGIGILFLPINNLLFSKFFDKGYVFSKTLGIGIVSYIILLLGSLHILPFGRLTIIAVLFIVLIFDVYILRNKTFSVPRKTILLIVLQEILFLSALLFWSYIKSFQPDIHGLEKFMDFGFMNSILRSTYFPPVDMWFPPFSINYYYFGHLVTAMLIKLTAIPNFVAYNLMLSTIFAFTFTSAFSIVSTLSSSIIKVKRTSILSGILAGILTTLGGNLHTIYTFFVPYTPADNPVGFWLLKFNPSAFPNSYWYPNATRFIPFTIHEFPSYSFVVSDLHGHVLDIPFVFLTIAIIFTIFLNKKITYRSTVLVGFFLAIMYMTNAWDGIIYFILFLLTIIFMKSNILHISKRKGKWFSVKSLLTSVNNKSKFTIESLKYIFVALISYLIFALPFNINFKPFVSGFGVLCPPEFLVKLGSIGPLIFEADHCQRSPFWMLIVLYGFFYFFAIALIIKILKISKPSMGLIFILLLILVSTILIAVPEFIYAKDIYPAHYRANTMFKLGYQAFIMLSLVSSFSIAYLFNKGRKIIWLPITLILLIMVLMYPYFAVNSYFGELKSYKGLDGLSYLKTIYPDDYDAIIWIQKNIMGQPVILEAQGDSYTDHGRISANTGLPTVLGWTVHEWLWRGDYSFPQSRLSDISKLFEGSVSEAKELIKKYNISYAFIGDLERTKYPNINEEKFNTLGKIVYQKGTAKIFKLNKF